MPEVSSGHLLAQAPNLGLLPLHLGEQAPAGGGAEWLVRAVERGRGRRGRPEPAVGVDDHLLAGDLLAVDALQEGGGLVAGGADADRSRLAGDAGVGDVDVVRAGGQVLAGAGAERQVRAPAGVGLEGVGAGGDVVVAGVVGVKGIGAGRDVAVAGGV